MLIDWFTVGAQALNFLILVWLLKRFLYRPVLGAIDAREKRIAAELADADARKADAQRERDEFQVKNRAFDEQRAALMSKAVADVGAERGRLLDGARNEAQALRETLAKAQRSDSAKIAGEIKRLATREVFEIARRALGDLATVSLEERMGEVFTRRLRTMGAGEKGALGEALRTSTVPAVVRSAFDLGPVQRAAIQNALNEDFSASVPLRFETAAGPICGIELTSNGQKVAWSIADYLSSLEKSVGELLGSETAAAPAAPELHPTEIQAEASAA